MAGVSNKEEVKFCDNNNSIGNSIGVVLYHKIEKKGINGKTLSHNQAMEHKQENQQENQQELTKGAILPQAQGGVVISTKEAAEYCEYKKQRKRADIRSAILKSEGVLAESGEAKKICERAVKYRQAAVRMTPTTLEYIRPWVQASGIKVDCLIGGNGETLSKVKAYEAKCALRLKAKELTVVLSPSMIAECRYAGVRKELKRLRRVAGKAVLKARLDRHCSAERLARVSKICSDVGVDYLSVPLYDGCERVQSGLSGKCRLEVFGVETLEEYRKLFASGVERIVTERVEEIQAEWLKEVEKIAFPKRLDERASAVKEELPMVEEQKEAEIKAEVEAEVMGESDKASRNQENEYKCRLEGAELKFL